MPPKILIVEGDETQRRFYKAALAGYDMVFATDGIDALHKLGYTPFFINDYINVRDDGSDKASCLCAVVTDWRLRRLDGSYVIRYALERGLAVGVIAADAGIEALEAGAHIAFAKPVDLYDLRSGVEQLISIHLGKKNKQTV